MQHNILCTSDRITVCRIEKIFHSIFLAAQGFCCCLRQLGWGKLRGFPPCKEKKKRKKKGRQAAEHKPVTIVHGDMEQKQTATDAHVPNMPCQD